MAGQQLLASHLGRLAAGDEGLPQLLRRHPQDVLRRAQQLCALARWCVCKAGEGFVCFCLYSQA